MKISTKVEADLINESRNYKLKHYEHLDVAKFFDVDLKDMVDSVLYLPSVMQSYYITNYLNTFGFNIKIYKRSSLERFSPLPKGAALKVSI